MATEIEHKYLVVSDEYKKMASRCYHIRQGYLNRDKERTVRVRVRDREGFLTIKGPTTGDSRAEYEYEIPLSDALNILEMCEGKIISKVRYIVPFGGYTWEVDEFKGVLDHLCVAEIELPESTHDYPLPPFVGPEVTGDSKYYNSLL